MPVPESVTTRVVKGTFIDATGAPMRGTVSFRLDQPLIATVVSWGVTPTVMIKTLDAGGSFEIELMVSTDIDLFPTGFRYIVQERFQQGYIRTYGIDLPSSEDDLELPIAAQYDPGDNGLAVVHSVNGRTGIVILAATDLGAIPSYQMGAAGGVATLDSGGKVPTSQLPAPTAGVSSVDGRTGVVTLNDLYAGSGHTHVYPVVTVNGETGNVVLTPADIGAIASLDKAQPLGIATLDSAGKLMGAQLPSLAITDVHDVASQSAMLALTAERGDLARRTDLNKTFILTATDPAVLSNWKELLTPADVVSSVNGSTGAVTITAISIGALATSQRGAANGVASLDSSTKVPLAQIPNIPGAQITSGLVNIDRIPTGSSGTTVALGNHTHPYVPTSEKGAASGVATLDGAGKVPLAQIPNLSVVSSVNGQVGLVVLTAADVSAVPLTQKGAVNGVASLDSASLIPVAQIPDLSGAKITSGFIDIARLPTGTASNQVALGNHTHPYIATLDKGVPGGVAGLDSGGKVPIGQLPTGTTFSSVSVGNHNHDDVYASTNDTRLTGAQQRSILTTKGDLYAATGDSTVVRVGVGTNGQVLVVDPTQSTGIKWADPAVGGLATGTDQPGSIGEFNQVGDSLLAARADHSHSGAPRPRVVAARIISGDIDPFPDTGDEWEVLSGFQLSIAAAEGDYVEIASDHLKLAVFGNFLDFGVIVGTTVVRYGSSGVATPALEGNPGWYPSTGFAPSQGPFGFTVTAGDLDSDNVRFVLVCKGIGTGKLYASPAYPFRWRAINFGPPAA